MKRRAWLIGSSCLLLGSSVWAAPRSDLERRRLDNRLELWSNYAKRTQNLLARYTMTRESSLLESPLVTTGTLAFAAPARLVLEDDASTGSTTLIDGETLHVVPNRDDLPTGQSFDLEALPAAAWLADRWIRLFAPGEPETLVERARPRVPKGQGYRLELAPPRGGVVRQSIRSLTLHFDPVAGAVTELAIAEAQGDRVEFRFTDHRQNVDDGDIEEILERARKRARQD